MHMDVQYMMFYLLNFTCCRHLVSHFPPLCCDNCCGDSDCTLFVRLSVVDILEIKTIKKKQLECIIHSNWPTHIENVIVFV